MRDNSSLPGIFLILLVSFFAFFVNNRIVPADLMESRNLATAQEMVRTGNYLVPTMNGELRLEKPPLPTWIAAGIEHIVPGNLSAQRCGSAFAATMMALFLYLLVARLTASRNIAVTAALIFATCFNPVMMGRTVSWDIYCHSFMMGAIYFLVRGFSSRCRGTGWMLLSGIFMGLSFLSKGPVSFFALLLPFLIAYAMVLRPDIKGKGLPVLILLITALISSLWWHGYLFLAHPGTMAEVAGKESSAWISYNVRPFWYYWQFPAEAGIWALFWVTSIVCFFTRRKPGRQRRIYAFSIIWLLMSLLLLSLIPEKKTRYLLPVLVPGAINIALYLWNIARNPQGRANRFLFRANAWVIALILAALPVVIYMQFVRSGMMPVLLFAVIAVVYSLLAVIIVTALYRRKGRIGIKTVFASVVISMMALEALCLPAVGSVFINEDRHSIRLLRDNPVAEGLPFYHEAGKPVRMELVYEANSLIRPLDLTDSTFVDRLPFVLISAEPASSLLEGRGLRIVHIDTYDNNWRKKNHKRHNPELVRHAAVVSLPEEVDTAGEGEE